MRYCISVYTIFLAVLVTATANGQNEPEPVPAVVNRAMAMLPGNQPVQRELELLDYQIKDIEQLRSGFQEKLRQARSKLGGKGGAERREKMKLLFMEVEESLSQTLLPRQSKRLKELAFQSFAVAGDGTLDLISLLSFTPVRKQLEISDETLKDLRETARQEQLQLEKEIRRLKQEARTRMLDKLSSKQKEKLDELVGGIFDFGGYAPGKNGEFQKVGSRDDNH